MKSTIWYLLRMSRSVPPGLAANDDQRRKLYRAAITQFEDLMDAAESAGPTGSPLPLYYALSQAGRAILSVRETDDSKVFATQEHHGLGISASDDLLATRVEPKRREIGQFQRVAAAIQSPSLEGGKGVELGALMASLPEIGDELWLDDRWPLAIGLDPLMRLTEASTVGDLGPAMDAAAFFGGRLRVAIMASEIDSQDDLNKFVQHYPSLGKYKPQLPVMLPSQKPGRHELATPYGMGIEIVLSVPEGSSSPVQDHAKILDELAPLHRWQNHRWVRPSIEVGEQPPNAFMTWWAILFTLSMLARYHPMEWTQALSVDRSQIAVVLERSLDLALEAIPHLVFENVLLAGGGPLLLPPSFETPPVGR